MGGGVNLFSGHSYGYNIRWILQNKHEVLHIIMGGGGGGGDLIIINLYVISRQL